VIWRFKPRCGDTEDALMAYMEHKENSSSEYAINSRKFLDSILLGWTDSKNKGMPAFSALGNNSLIFTTEERSRLFTYWNKANTLNEDEKKT
jgi:hypothetical protein